jgi:hypothetical protein
LTDFQTSLGYFLRFLGRETHQRTNTVIFLDFFKNSLIIKKILKNAVFWAIFHTVCRDDLVTEYQTKASFRVGKTKSCRSPNFPPRAMKVVKKNITVFFARIF